MYSYSWTAESRLLNLKSKQTKKKEKQENKKETRSPQLFFFTFPAPPPLHSGGGDCCYYYLGSLDLELFMCITYFGIPAIFMKRSYRITCLHNISLLDQQLIMAPVFYIILSATSLNPSSGNLPFSSESPELPLASPTRHCGWWEGKENRARGMESNEKTCFLPPLLSSEFLK